MIVIVVMMKILSITISNIYNQDFFIIFDQHEIKLPLKDIAQVETLMKFLVFNVDHGLVTNDNSAAEIQTDNQTDELEFIDTDKYILDNRIYNVNNLLLQLSPDLYRLHNLITNPHTKNQTKVTNEPEIHDTVELDRSLSTINLLIDDLIFKYHTIPQEQIIRYLVNGTDHQYFWSDTIPENQDDINKTINDIVNNVKCIKSSPQNTQPVSSWCDRIKRAELIGQYEKEKANSNETENVIVPVEEYEEQYLELKHDLECKILDYMRKYCMCDLYLDSGSVVISENFDASKVLRYAIDMMLGVPYTTDHHKHIDYHYYIQTMC